MAASDQVQLDVLGANIALQTKAGEVSGTLFGWTGVGADRVLVVCQPGSTTYTNDITLLKHDAVQAARSVIFPTSGDDSNQPLPAVDAQRSKEREERAVRAAQLEASKIGTGVSEQAQAVFDAVSKTMPCRWDGQTIVVLDEVFIEEPYSTENLTTLNSDDMATLERVKKVVSTHDLRHNLVDATAPQMLAENSKA